MFERVEHAPELFLVAVDKETGTIAGFLNGLATDEEAFRDEFSQILPYIIRKERIFSFLGWMSGQNTAGRSCKRNHEPVRKREQAKGQYDAELTCLEQKVEMYKKMGYKDEGISASVWGDEEWHEMSYAL